MCSSIHRGSGRWTCCRASPSLRRSGCCTCPATPGRWRAISDSWCTNSDSNCSPPAWSICLRTLPTWNRWRCCSRAEAAMAIEIERKFVVLGERWRPEVSSSTLLRQGYLANTARASVRVRLAGNEAWLSVKAMTPGAARAEYEVAIPVADGQDMLGSLCEGPLIEKWRHIVVYAGDRWEIDEFLGDNAGLVVAEIELESETQQFVRPDWLGAEVTHQERYYNFRLSQRPYRQWPDSQRDAR